jgi:hypothetical protein
MKEKARVRRDVERRLRQSIKLLVHEGLLAKTARGGKKTFLGEPTKRRRKEKSRNEIFPKKVRSTAHEPE